MKKLCVFDLDGTLLDTLPDITDSINAMLTVCGLPNLDMPTVKSHIGNGVIDLVRGCTKCDGEKLLAQNDMFISMYFASGSKKTYAYEKMDVVLRTLKEKGYVVSVLTNKDTVVANDVLKRNFDFAFDDIICGGDGYPLKPNPDALNYLMEKHGVKKENTFMIGDGDTDVKCGLNAGANAISVTWGYVDKEVLEKAGATNFANTPDDILEFIK